MSEPTSTYSEPHLVIIGPVANVDSEPEELNALNKCHNAISAKILHLLRARKGIREPYVGRYTSIHVGQSYGGFMHMRRLAENMVVIANDLYLDLCCNSQRINEVHIVVCESGVYLAVKIMELIDLYGDSLTTSTEKFDKYWIKLLLGEPMIDLPPQPGFKISAVCRTMVLIEPSLPVLGFLARWLAYPCVYDRLDLVAPKGEKRLLLLLRTNQVGLSTHRRVEIAGAESVNGGMALVKRFEEFIRT